MEKNIYSVKLTLEQSGVIDNRFGEYATIIIERVGNIIPNMRAETGET